MTETKIIALFKRYKEGKCTPTEKAVIESWYIHASKSAEIPKNRSNFIKRQSQTWISLGVKKHKIKHWPRLAAACIIVLFSAGYFLGNKYFVVQHNIERLQNSKADLNPGKNSAVVTSSGGEKIVLSSTKSGVVINGSKLKYSDGTSVKSGAIGGNLDFKESILATISTPRGGTYTITLSDGTKVIMNAASSLRFPVSFANAKERRLELTGEAYFIVKHIARQPFYVISRGQVVEDIGTEFNINAYADESNTKTTLVEGSAKVSALETRDVVLVPNHQTILLSGTLQLKKVDVQEAIAWKNGLFYFKNTPIQTVMRQISRWYDVEVLYQTEDLKEKLLGGSVSRYDKVSGILNAIEQTGAVKFKIVDRKVIVTK